MEEIVIRKGTIADCISISEQIPEFTVNYQEVEYQKRLYKVFSLILIAELDDEIVGFKVGYNRDEFFYSWLGGILPKYRNQDIAKRLSKEQEKEVKERGYNQIRFKTYNKYKAMLIFGLRNGFEIQSIEAEDGAIWLKKDLL